MSNSSSADVSAEPIPRIAIAEALRNHWFETWYQPKVDLKRKCLAGAESLARLCHPQLGVMLPGSFLPEVDENSIGKLAEHGLLATLSDWTIFDEAGFNLHIAVNVPASALRKLPILRLVSEHRPQSPHWPGLIVEVAEDQIVRNLALIHEFASGVESSGVTLAVDEFGAGYSSFSSLRHLPFAELKIARGLVSGCSTDAANGAICQTAIDLAHRLGSTAVADGVDSAADLQALIEMGCDFGQGPIIAPPLPKQEFLDLLLQRNAPQPRAPRDIFQAAARPIGRVA
jgi:EAL domain-containing protein (putative c-di-GMP-specific phosphodiesterase class I)